ncbi:MAG: trypsin-like peptidase domain-containing protein [Desulfomonile tiedjei]|nr:trypsin-like peptidase domain-containing protein [Desulfomonile tiedjei]
MIAPRSDQSLSIVPRRHPLALTSFIIAVAGIPFFGLLTGMVAVFLGGVALGQISADPLFRGRRWAVAAIVLGIADMALWVVAIGILLPRVTRPEEYAVKQSMVYSFKAAPHAPEKMRRALESNVLVAVETPRRIAFLGSEKSSGSGVILGSRDGAFLILTNRHVVDPHHVADEVGSVGPRPVIRTYFYDGVEMDAYTWWVDPEGADLAVLATGKDPESIPVPDADNRHQAQIGEKVFTVGNPVGLTWTYTEGVISGFREIGQGPGRLQILQTQTPINQGNSGGGLYTMDGTLLGIVSWTKAKADAEGISFAITYQDFAERFKRSQARVGQKP